jgi:predicted DNA-binding protein with PD1-like motif
MKAKLIHSGEQKTYALIFEKDDEVIAGLTSFAKQQSLGASHFTAIGAFSDVTLGYFNRDKKDYDKIPVKEQVEVLSVMGDIALNKGEPKIHAHVVIGKRDGSTLGGHLVQAHVWPTLEVVLTESPRHLRRKTDKETGLALIELQD